MPGYSARSVVFVARSTKGVHTAHALSVFIPPILVRTRDCSNKTMSNRAFCSFFWVFCFFWYFSMSKKFFKVFFKNLSEIAAGRQH